MIGRERGEKNKPKNAFCVTRSIILSKVARDGKKRNNIIDILWTVTCGLEVSVTFFSFLGGGGMFEICEERGGEVLGVCDVQANRQAGRTT